MPSHAGGIVFRKTPRGHGYLLVRAHSDPSQWIFPKGRVERGETPEAAALREVREEAGVRASVIAPLSPIGPGGQIALFLMRYEGDVPTDEAREPVWLDYDEARQRLSFPESRDVLVQARDRVEKG